MKNYLVTISLTIEAESQEDAKEVINRALNSMDYDYSEQIKERFFTSICKEE